MEKYSAFRDRGSGISPFLPTPLQERPTYLLPFYFFLFVIRLPVLLGLSLSYLLFLQWLPLGSLGKKAMLWCMLGTPGIWWIDLQIDGVRRGSLGTKANKPRLPSPGNVIASSFTSPIDCLYLAAIFDPIFTISYPKSRKVRQISLRQAIVSSLSTPSEAPPNDVKLTTIGELVRENPHAIILVFPECTTSNGRGILNPSPSLLTASPKTKIFPLNLRYSPADITTPVPGAWLTFLWNLCSKPTNSFRIRIAESVHNTSAQASSRRPYDANFFDTMQSSDLKGRNGITNGIMSSEDDDDAVIDDEGQKVLDQVMEGLARLGRVKRVNLGVSDKRKFVVTWTKHRRIW